MILYKIVFPSPIGDMILVTHENAICALDFSDRWLDVERGLRKRFGNLQFCALDSSSIASQVRAYFAGNLKAIDGIPVDPGGTPFQQKVWRALQKIPVGETTSYGKLAASIGSPGSSRAVGTANGSNPVGIVIPCHRVIGGDGALRGYAGGVERKRWLLSHEMKRDCGRTTEHF